MDIGSKTGYPAAALSNFSPHPFIFDGVQINSMEGFLQALKFSNFEMQKEVCKLVGVKSKFKGKKKNRRVSQILYWNNIEYKRDSNEYQELLDKAYNAMFEQSDSFRRVLKASEGANFTHSIGKNKQNETVLTNNEFISRLNTLRSKL